MNRRQLLQYGGIGAVAGLAGCLGGNDSDGGDDGSGDGGDASGDSQTDESGGSDGGELEDQLNVYGPVRPPITDGFEEEFDVEANVVTAPGGQIFARLANEYTSNEHTADVMRGAISEYIREAELWQEVFTDRTGELVSHDDYLEDDVQEELERVTPEELLPYMRVDGTSERVFVYNTDTVDDPPQSYEDLLDPRFEDEICSAQFTIDTNLGVMERLFDDTEKAEQYLVDIAEYTSFVGGGFQGITDRVISEEFKIGWNIFGGSGVADRLAEDAPIDVVYPEEGVPLTMEATSALAEAPNPNAAEQWIDFELSTDGQEYIRDYQGGRLPVHRDVEHGNPTLREKRQDADIVPMIFPPEKRNELTQRSEELLDL